MTTGIFIHAKRIAKRCHSSLSPVFDRRAVLPHCCPETSLMPRREERRWTRITTRSPPCDSGYPQPVCLLLSARLGSKPARGLALGVTSRHTAVVVIVTEATRPERLDLTETFPLSKSSTSGAGHFHGESESLSKPMSPQGGPSPGSRPAGLGCSTHPRKCPRRRGEQTRQSQLLLRLWKGSPGQCPPAALASKLRWEEAAAGAVSSPESLMTACFRGKPWVGVRLPVGLRLLQGHQEPPAAGRHRGHWPSPARKEACATPASSHRRQRPSSRGCRF